MLHTGRRTLSILTVEAVLYPTRMKTEDKRLDWLASPLLWAPATSESPLLSLLSQSCAQETLSQQPPSETGRLMYFSAAIKKCLGDNQITSFALFLLSCEFPSYPACSHHTQENHKPFPSLWLVFRSLNIASVHVI